MNVEHYLARIGLDHRPTATFDGLRTLHRAHLLAISYENIDVQLRCPVTIEREPIYEKIVQRRRGGWCYEMNGLFGWALDALGFDVTRATGAVMRETMGEQSEGNHLVLKVSLEEGVYLADVGFGDGPLDPIGITPGTFRSAGFDFELSRIDDEWWRLENHSRGRAKSFDFKLDPADESLLAEKCTDLQSSPMSPFVQNLVTQRHTPAGLLILRGKVLRQIAPDAVHEQTLTSPDELVAVLRDRFDLKVPEVATLWPKICARHEEALSQQQSVAQRDPRSGEYAA